jgi:hypothetical protein
MLKTIWCWIWGHKTVVKKFTGETTHGIVNGLGDTGPLMMYVWRKEPFCLRCGKDTV